MIIGFDLDGVLAKRPRIFKLNHSKGKHRLSLPFWEQWFWRLVMWIREPSKKMVDRLKKLDDEGHTIILITGRLSFLEDLTLWWISRYGIRKYFDKVVINAENKQPYEFKAEEINRHKVDEFYEDDLYTADYLKGKTKSRIFLVVANGEIVKEM